MGILRYCGCTDFAKGQWAGVELHEPLGKNDGSVGGKTYFQCKPKHGTNISYAISSDSLRCLIHSPILFSSGIFCPVSKISKPKTQTRQKTRPNSAKLHSHLARVVHAKHTGGGSLPSSRSSSRSTSPQPGTKPEDNIKVWLVSTVYSIQLVANSTGYQFFLVP